MKKLLALLLCCTTLFTAASCGEKKEGTDDIVTLKWIVPGTTPEDLPLVTEKINEITMEKIGAKVEFQYIDTGAYKEKMNTYMATSYKYDLAFAGAYNPLVNAASKGGIIPIEDLLEQYPDLKASIPDYAWELTKYDGKIYGIPNLQVLPDMYGVCFENKYLKDMEGVDPYSFKKLEDLEPFLEKAKKYFEDNGMTKRYAFGPMSNTIMPTTFDYCSDYDKIDDVMFKQDENGEWKGTMMWATPGYRKGVEKLHEWYEKGYINPDVLSTDTASNVESVTYLTIYKPGLEAIYKGQNRDLSVQLIQTPVITKCNAMTVIGKDSQNPELALKLMNLVNTDKEFYNLITLGIEGVHYEKTGENTFKYIGTAAENKYFVNAGWKFGNQFNEYVIEGNEPTVWEETAAYNDSAKLSPFAGFAIDNTSIRTELTQIETLVSSYSAMNLGVDDPDEYYDEFLEKLEQAGASKVVAEYERQINEFMKNK